MRNKIITILSVVIFSIILMGNTSFASGMNMTKDYKEVFNEKKIENKKMEKLRKDDICKDISKVMKKSGFKEVAKYIRKCDHEKMQDFMMNIEKEDYQNIIKILKESGYHQMVGMLETMQINGITKMSNSMSKMKECTNVMKAMQ